MIIGCSFIDISPVEEIHCSLFYRTPSYTIITFFPKRPKPITSNSHFHTIKVHVWWFDRNFDTERMLMDNGSKIFVRN